MEQPFPGQRWVSDTEPELGLGIIVKAEYGRVSVHFPAAQEQRQYSLQTAPLRRVRFAEGDRIKLHEGVELLVERVEEKAGLLIYHAGGRAYPEAELSDAINFSKPEDRLLAGQVDELSLFDLRTEGLRHRSRLRQSAARGFIGGRVDLIPHQLYIAGEVAGRLRPRVLLADEVGLGKTIEAGLILHRLHQTGRAARILILLPEPLVHQWFVEMLRRFNLLFSLFDEERCESIEQHDPEANPFLDSQLVICPVGYLAGAPTRAVQAVQAGWDLVVVDEAHHLEWSPEASSPEYRLVEALAAAVPGLLLLTATPQQLGPEGHFARLRLLDPERYSDLETFLAESARYEKVASAIDRVLENRPLTKEDKTAFSKGSGRIRELVEQLGKEDKTTREKLVGTLLDEFGTGRVMFRNTRKGLTGFPKREPHLEELDPKEGELGSDAKIRWLAGLLRDLDGAKVLLICKTRELVEKISTAIQGEINVPVALFHEELTLLQRDRNAAYFAEEEGARLLICSEIGSEGRNFQFAHHLVLWDLPANPELLEQRIGRLDRIGQRETIHIHIPYVVGTEGEVLARWYHEGLNAFAQSLRGGAELRRTLGDDLDGLLTKSTPAKLTKFLTKSKAAAAKLGEKLERGNDRLLELNSNRPEKAAELIRQMSALDADREFESFLVRLFDHFGVQVEELSARTYLLKAGHIISDSFPSLPEEGISVTLDRPRALSRDDLGFMSADHPLVRSAWDLLLSSEMGNSAYGLWKSGGSEAIFLEVYLVVECIAPASLHVDRFLPATPVRVVLDHALNDHTEDEALQQATLEKDDIFRLLDRGAVKKKLIPAMLAKAQEVGEARGRSLVEGATRAMKSALDGEISRMEELLKRSNQIRAEEVAALHQQKEDLATALAGAQTRLDALRLIFRTA